MKLKRSMYRISSTKRVNLFIRDSCVLEDIQCTNKDAFLRGNIRRGKSHRGKVSSLSQNDVTFPRRLYFLNINMKCLQNFKHPRAAYLGEGGDYSNNEALYGNRITSDKL